LENRCFVCGRVFEKKQSLRAHLKVHKGEYKEVSFLAVKSTYEEFKKLCGLHGLTTCHMLNSIMWALAEALRGNKTVEFDARTEEMRMKGGSNPLTIVLNQTFLGKPRSAWKTPLQESCKLWPPSCEFADDFIRSLREVGCTRSKEWTRLEECWSCFQRGNHGP